MNGSSTRDTSECDTAGREPLRGSGACFAVLLAAVTALPDAAEAAPPASSEHHIGVFAGLINRDGDKAEPAYGAEYSWRASRRFGLGLSLQDAPDAAAGAGMVLSLAHIHYYPAAGLRLSAGLGEQKVGARNSEALYRLAARYDVPLPGGFTVAPGVAVDQANGETGVVFGAVFSRRF